MSRHHSSRGEGSRRKDIHDMYSILKKVAGNRLYLASSYYVHQFFVEGISVLLQETFTLIFYLRIVKKKKRL